MRKGIIKYVLFMSYLTYSYSLCANEIELESSRNKYPLNRFISESLSQFSDLKIATLNINNLALELDKVASQLGWVLTSQGGYSRDSSSFGIQSDTIDLGIGLEKKLESGSTVSLTGVHAHNDSDQVLSNLSPNPSDTTNIDLNYRIPMMEGNDNQQYLFDLQKAQLDKNSAELEKEQIKETLILKLIDVYYLVATIDSRLNTANRSLKRTRKLRKYINNNINLGLLEKGDILQVNSQIYTLRLERQRILDLKEKQIVSINRFLNRDYSSGFIVETTNFDTRLIEKDSKIVIDNTLDHDYEIRKLKIQSNLLDSALALSRNREKDKLDLILSVGVQNRHGNSNPGSIDDTDTTGMIKFEYRNALDKRAFSSQRLQIQTDRQKNIEQIASLTKDLEYEAYSQYKQVIKSKEIVELTDKRSKNEKNKYQDILKRYKNGRSTTNIVIQFDNERIRAELEYETERYELLKRVDLLLLKQGLLLN